MWDADLDFTAQSLQISTSPQLRLKSTSRLDDIRSREIHNLTARAVATNRLEEIRERNSEERSLGPAIKEYPEKTILEEEGQPIPNTPITVFGKNDWDDYVKRKNPILSASTQGEDPHDLLRRLSRSLSSSPEDLEPVKVSDLEPTDDPEERITAEARLFDLQDKSEKGSIRTVSPTEDFDETPRPKSDPLSLPTPKVTGAYIDTPLTIKTRSRSPRRRTREYRPSSRFRDSRPPSVNAATSLINTATHVSAIEDLRRIQLESNVEDSTLDNLESLGVPPPAEVTTTVEPVLDLEYNNHGLPLSQKEIDRRVEEITLERMNKSLKATTSSIRDARKGIERLEEQVSSSFVKVAQTQSTSRPDDATTYININLNIPIPKLWISQLPSKPGMKDGWKFTWLGLLMLLFAVWYVLESATCAKFCHPTNSRVNTWQPSDPFFPWAIPTKLDQWTGEVISSTIGGLADLFGVTATWDWSFGLPNLPNGYTGGPIGASDWWLGREGPVGIKHEDKSSSFGDDEMI
ncbi:hypothetical protein D0Z07_3904 [Hyphodiscus hymeniophilus]|uniref:Uncharacterized protein n=1 Tax=Hyphodiscus hymeniophilus TaxID=353542 RepID=A0A9P6VK89_9HELO|nr:hypothetical protein D0Z07_3904 [Hyphodiscus hymeniophilus]